APGVGGFIDSVAHRKIGPVQAFAAADINDVGIGGRYRYRADRASGLIVKDRIPSAAIVIGLPHAAIDHANVKDVGLTRHAGGGFGSATAVRADAPPLKLAVSRRWDLGGGSSGSGENCGCQKDPSAHASQADLRESERIQ